MLDQQFKKYKQVYELVQKVPKGKVTTYGAIGKKLNMSPRVVGYALHINPNSNSTPCYRVVNRNGRIAENYAFGGANGQRKRLEKEKVKFINKLHVNLKNIYWESI